MYKTRDIAEYIEKYMIDVINERNYSNFGMFMRGVLFVLSRIYRNGMQFRLWLYDKGIIKRSSLGCLVVSIGNLTCGGTGKTPVVEVFAKTLARKGRKVAVLSRGYKSRDRTLMEKFFIAIPNMLHPKLVE